MDDPSIKNANLNLRNSENAKWATKAIARHPDSRVRYADLIQTRKTVPSLPPQSKTTQCSDAHEGDVLLYEAYRDCLEPRKRCSEAEEVWRADLIQFTGKPLPGGEPCRSIGHWNPPEQVEIFEVIEGRVVLLVMTAEESIEALDCLPGESWVIPKGSFHLTYAITRSLVINIYNSKTISKDVEKYERKIIPSLHLSGSDERLSILQNDGNSMNVFEMRAFPTRLCYSLPTGILGLHTESDSSFYDRLSRSD